MLPSLPVGGGADKYPRLATESLDPGMNADCTLSH